MRRLNVSVMVHTKKYSRAAGERSQVTKELDMVGKQVKKAVGPSHQGTEGATLVINPIQALRTLHRPFMYHWKSHTMDQRISTPFPYSLTCEDRP